MMIPAFKPDAEGNLQFCPACAAGWALIAAAVIIIYLYLSRRPK
jgi:hypothetical protein